MDKGKKIEHSILLLPCAYLPSVEYLRAISSNKNILVEHYENFVKQSCRSRCEIYSPNGKQMLSIPLVKRNHKQIMKDVKISYDYDWQLLHWRSLESAYRRSPFFEYYEDEFNPFFAKKKYEYLLDLNDEFLQLVLNLMKLKTNYAFTNEYKAVYENTNDLRNTDFLNHLGVMTQIKPYNQVFEIRHGFLSNLSIVDLLFNEGPRALDYIL